ncbi:MAG TPA: SdrD B-like domain-containing protein, partial [Vicinamibacterales bacterium]
SHLTACGSLPIALAPYSDAGPRDALYVIWLTPAFAFDGDPTLIDQVCGTGCFHGFHADASLTAAFRVEDKPSCDDSFCVSGVAFSDLNGNGVRDSGEPGLDGIPVRVESASGLILTGLTAPDGSFDICGLTSGQSFRVSSPAPLGFNLTGPIDSAVASASSRVFAKDFEYVIEVCMGNVPSLIFPNQPLPNAIGGLKFEDTNGDGIREPGEPPLGGVTINLGPAVGPPSQTTTTAADGTFLFTNVTPGSYVLTETVPGGFTQTVPPIGGIAVTLPPGGSSLDNVFGNFPGILKGKVIGSVFNDINGDGIRDSGEPAMFGIHFTLQLIPPPPAPPGSILQSVVSDSHGDFEFDPVPFGQYQVAEQIPSGFRVTTPSPTGTTNVSLDVAHRTVNVLFGNQTSGASISGMKFNDANGNGVLDPGELGVAGVTIVLTSGTPGQGTPVMTTTDSNGNFSFTSLQAGAYTVSEVLPPGFIQTVPGGGGTISVTVATGEAKTGLLFGNQAVAGGTASISGLKYLDLNKDGVINGLDRPFPGIVFVLTDAAGNTKTTTSATDGTFSFTGLAPGTYVLSEVLPPNTVQTFPGTPTNPKTYTITLTPGQKATGYLFLNKC